MYAHAVASVFLIKKFKVHLFSQVVATPLVPFALTQYKCVAGIQITASHNPKDDNGYKVYASNGALIIPPMDTEVSELILNNLKPDPQLTQYIDSETGLIKSDLFKKLTNQGLIVDPYDELSQKYTTVLTEELCLEPDVIQSSDLQVVYTPMHGVGYKFVESLFKSFGIKESHFHVVEEQKSPDPEFTTVKFPNPEEKGALDLAISLAEKLNVPMVIANDPDADRFACAEKNKETGTWKIFTGDELGFLFATHRFKNLTEQKKIDPQRLVFVCSAVSSRILQKFARIEQCIFDETMTGFKWIMNRSLELTTGNKIIDPPVFALAYEEALGYGITTTVPDKDGISAAAVWYEMAAGLYQKNITVAEHLDNLYKKYGYSCTNNSYFICHEPAIIKQIVSEFRNNGEYKKSIGKFQLSRIRDVTARYDNGQPDCQCLLPFVPNSDMITLYFDTGVTITFRTSGTEPKFKWYAEVIANQPAIAKPLLDQTLDECIEHFIQFDKFQKHLHRA